MTRIAYLTAIAALAFATPALAGPCADQIRMLEGKAAGSDAGAKPGSQANTSSPGTSPKEGGGEVSSSAKVLEAKAHDEKGDEANCMKAIEEAKKTIK